MVIILWEYQVKADREAEFKAIYASNGAWAELFRKGKGFLGTQSFHSGTVKPLHDRRDQWETINDYQTFSIGFNDEE